MCTAAAYKTADLYFGRTLDIASANGEEIVVTPRHYPFSFRHLEPLRRHHALIGVACVAENYPLYYDAVNEAGLGMAGLNFAGNADYKAFLPDRQNVAQYELIPWILGQCATVREAKALLEHANLVNAPFRRGWPPAQLHWLIADRDGAVTVEAMKDGIHIDPNPVGILTNNPPFQQQLFQLNNYMHLSPREPENRFSDKLPLQPYTYGMGALGLPGDLSSQSRFVRAAFTKLNSVSGDSEPESVSQFFHILGSVSQTRGCNDLGDGKYEMTVYTSCCNADKGICYYTTYNNHQITAVDMHREDLDSGSLIRYPMICEEQIRMQNCPE